MKTFVRKGTEHLGSNQVLMWVKIEPGSWFMVDMAGGKHIREEIVDWEPSTNSFDLYTFE